MNRLLIVFLLTTVSLPALHAQSKWFFSVISGASVGGPAGSIASNMRENNLANAPGMEIF